jgi:hypothetical protein
MRKALPYIAGLAEMLIFAAGVCVLIFAACVVL